MDELFDDIDLDDMEGLSGVLVNVEDSDTINIDSNTGNITDFLNIIEDARKKENCIDHHPIEMEIYQDTLQHAPSVIDSITEISKKYPAYQNLNEDMFLMLYKNNPTILHESKVKDSRVTNNMILKELIKSPSFADLKVACSEDNFCSIVGTEVLTEESQKYIDEWVRLVEEYGISNNVNNPLDDIADLMQLEEELDDLDTSLNALDDLINDPNNAGSLDDLVAIQDDLLKKQNTVKNRISSIQNSLIKFNQTNLPVKLGQGISNAAGSAKKIVSDVRNTLADWGLGDSNENAQYISYDSKRQAVSRIRDSKKLMELTNLIGKFKDTALKDQKRKSKKNGVSIKTVTTGNSLVNALPSEKMKLANDTTKKDFFRRLNQNQIMQYQLDNRNKKCKGPIICCVDTSGSMSGSPEKWSKAVALAILEIAQLQKRDFGGILFSSNVSDVLVIEKDKLEPEKILDFAEKFDGGGTNFEKPLRASLELIESSKFKKADIIFITDGESSVSEDFLKKFKKAKEDKEFSVMSIAIDTDGGISVDSLKEFSDKIVPLTSLTDLNNSDSDIAHEIFSSLQE